MLRGLAHSEYEAVLLSVGGGLKSRRPLSPVEVGECCKRARQAGETPTAITLALQMTDTSMIRKFIRVAELPQSIRHLVDWGRSRSSAIGFSVAAQLARLADADQESLAELILKFRVSKAEMLSIIQLAHRSGDSLRTCVHRVVNRRTVVIVRQVVLGAILIPSVSVSLARLSQRERDEALAHALEAVYPSLRTVIAKLGSARFTFVGGRALGETIGRDGDFESKISRQLARQLAPRAT